MRKCILYIILVAAALAIMVIPAGAGEIRCGGGLCNGTDSADTMLGTNGADTIQSFGGTDTVVGYAGVDYIYMGGNCCGAEFGHGFNNDDVMYGQEGADYLYGGGGSDTEWGGDGDDHVIAGCQPNTCGEDPGFYNDLHGGNGNDVLGAQNSNAGDSMDGGAGYDTCYWDPGDDYVVNCEVLG